MHYCIFAKLDSKYKINKLLFAISFQSKYQQIPQKSEQTMKVIGNKSSKQYQLKQVLGQGSFGKVYYSPPYAIKQITLNLNPYLRSALNNQIKILTTVKHPNIVDLYDVVYESNYVYLVMEFCQTDLAKYIKKNKIDQPKAIEIFKQILSGFRELVSKGIIHRDLKPANILVNAKGQFKLADFGFAKFVQHYDSNMLQSCVGTPLYMAPQILKKGKYSTKCDIWSIGFIFYELAIGSIPWTGYSQANLLQNITKRSLKIPENVSLWSRQILQKMLIVNENDRISWEQLFKYALGNESRGRSNSKKKDGNSRNNTPAKSQGNIKVQKGTPRGSEKQLPIPKNQPKKTVSCQQNSIIQLFIIQLKDYFSQQKALKIGSSKNYVVSSEDEQKVKEVLQLFSDEFQNYFKRRLIFGRC